MLETPITLGNICRVLLNLIKTLMFKDSSPPNFHAVNIHISSLVHQLRMFIAFVPLSYLFR